MAISNDPNSVEFQTALSKYINDLDTAAGSTGEDIPIPKSIDDGSGYGTVDSIRALYMANPNALQSDAKDYYVQQFSDALNGSLQANIMRAAGSTMPAVQQSTIQSNLDKAESFGATQADVTPIITQYQADLHDPSYANTLGKIGAGQANAADAAGNLLPSASTVLPIALMAAAPFTGGASLAIGEGLGLAGGIASAAGAGILGAGTSALMSAVNGGNIGSAALKGGLSGVLGGSLGGALGTDAALAGPSYGELGITGLDASGIGPSYADMGFTGLNQGSAIAAADLSAFSPTDNSPPVDSSYTPVDSPYSPPTETPYSPPSESLYTPSDSVNTAANYGDSVSIPTQANPNLGSFNAPTNTVSPADALTTALDGSVPSSIGMDASIPAGSMVGDGTLGTTMGSTYLSAAPDQLALDSLGNPIESSSIGLGGISSTPMPTLSDALKAANTVKQTVSAGSALAKLLASLGGSSSSSASSGLNSQQLASSLSNMTSQPQTNSFIGQYKMNENPFLFNTPGQTTAVKGVYDVSGSNLANALRKA